MDKLKVVIIGCGMISSIHAEAFSACPDWELLGFYDVRKESAQKAAERFGVSCFGTWQEVCASGADVCSVATPNGTHAELAVRVMEAGMHAVVEKPLGMCREECGKIIEAEKRTGKYCAPISQMRLFRGVLAAKALLVQGKLGKICSVALSACFFRVPAYYAESGWHGNASLDGGVLLNQAIHGLDLVCFLMGRPVKVSAVGRTVFHPIETPDTVCGTFAFPCGALGTFEAGTADYPGFPTRIRILGTEGSLVLVDGELTERDGRPVEQERDARNTGARDPGGIGREGHLRQLESIARSLKKNEKPDYTAEDAAETVALIDEIREEIRRSL